MKILVFSPHPDDESIGCGGVLTKHKLMGSTVQTVFMTSGEQGKAGTEPDMVKVIREGEALRAAERLGTLPPKFLRYPDGELADFLPARVKATTNLIIQENPDVIFVPSEDDEHVDHKATFYMVVDGLRSLKINRPDIEIHPEVYMYEVWTPLTEYDLVEDISEYIGNKILAIREHYSQIERIRFDEAALCLARYRGELHNRPHGPYAEVFKKVTI